MPSPTNTSSPSDPQDWTTSDAMVLESLSGLDELMINEPEESAPPARSTTPAPARATSSKELDFTPPSEALPATSGFRTARELRAAKQRFAAQRRSAARRGEQTQGVGFEPSLQEQILADSETVSRSFAKPLTQPSPVVSTPMVKPQPPQTGAVTLQSPPSRPSTRRTMRVPLVPAEQPAAAPPNAPSPQPEAAEVEADPKQGKGTKRGKKRTRRHEPTPSSQTRTVTPEMEPQRNRSSSASRIGLGTTILLSVAATSLLWAAMLGAFSKFAGNDWLENRFTGWFQPAIQERVDPIETTARRLESELTDLTGRYENLLRLDTLESTIFTNSKRDEYEQLVSLGKRMSESTPAEASRYQRARARIEQAYIRRLGDHKGLPVNKLFPKLGVSRDTRVGFTTLLDYLSKRDEPAWDRARAAVLLRRFKDNDQVITALHQIIRDDQDLTVMFAAWDSLVKLTGYEADKGFNIDHFHQWWRKQER